MALFVPFFVFVLLVVISLPIVYALGLAAILGLLTGGHSLLAVASSLVSGSQGWVLLAIPAFIFSGILLERCGMSTALVNLARAMLGWLPGGLGVSVIAVAYLVSDLCGSIIAEVSTISSAMTKPLRRAGYSPEDTASLIASGAAMGMLVPPAIFMIVISAVTNTSSVALFLAGFIPAAIIAFCLCIVVVIRAKRRGWPRDPNPTFGSITTALRDAAIPLLVPIFLLGGLYSGIFTTTETGAIIALFSVVVARWHYKNVSWREMGSIACDAGMLTAAVVFLTAVATVYQYLLGISGVPRFLGEVFAPLQATPWLFLIGVAALTLLIGMVLEGLPAAVLFVPVVFPISQSMGINSVHFCIVQTAAVGIGLFMPPLGLGLLVTLRFAGISVAQHARHYSTFFATLLFGLLLIIIVPELSLFLPRMAGLVR
jgi:tripartite ATP-independent transporter DctM subunit